MAVFLRRNFKLTNLARSFCFRKTSYNVPFRVAENCTNRSYLEKLYSTAAVNYKVNYDVFENKGNIPFKVTAKDDQDIDETLEDIDRAVRRTGRTVIDRVQSLFQKIENAGFATETQSLYLLRCCGLLHLEPENTRVELVDKMWDKFKMLGVKLDIKHFNALLKVYLDCNNDFAPSDILISIEQSNVEPDQTTYSYLIEKYCRDGNLNGANEILEYLKEKNIPVNEYVFNSLIKGHLKLNDEEGAREIMEVMRNSNITPTAYTYTTLACCYANKGNADKVEEIISEAEAEGIKMEINNFLQILLSSAPNKETGLIERVVQGTNNLFDWRQDFINCAAELVHKGCDEVAYKLIMAISSTEYSSATNNFIKVLIKDEVPVERVVKYATEMYDNGFNNFIFTNAAMLSVELGKIDHAVAFFNEMQARGIPVRRRNFRPLFIANKHSSSGIWKIIKSMGALGVPLDFVTYEEHILPFITPGSPKEFLSKLEEHDQSVLNVIDPLFDYYCSNEKIEHALYLLENYHVGVNRYFNLEHYLSLYNKFRSNSNAYFKVLKYVLENAGLTGQNVNLIRGKQLAAFLQLNPKVFESFHKSFVGQGCHHNVQSMSICRRIIRLNSPDLLPYLRRIGITNDSSNDKPFRKITVEEEEAILNSTETGTVKEKNLLDLLSNHLLNRNLDRAFRVKSELDSANIILPPALYSKMFFLQCEMDHLEEAKESFQKIKELYPNFKIDTNRIFDYARLLLKYSYTDESINILRNECQEVTNYSGSETLLRSVRRYMNNITQTGDVDLAKTVQDLLVSRPDFSELKEVVLESVIKIYIHKRENDNAVKAFENCVINFGCSPCLLFLMKKLIVFNEQSNLQTVVDLASKVEGKVKVLHRLALAFLDVDHLQQASRVFQSLNQDINYGFLEEISKNYFSTEDVAALENILYATFNCKSGSKGNLYNLVISLCCKNNQYEKCCKILDLMKKENVNLSDECKEIVNNLCTKNNKPLHFPGVEQSSDNTVVTSNASSANETITFLKFLQEEKLEKALKELMVMKKGYIRTIPFQEMSNLIELLVKENCLNSLSSITPAMVYIIDNSTDVLKPLLEKYSDNGDVAAMVALSNVFPDFSLKKNFFNRFLAQAYSKSNRQEDLLSELEARSQKKNKLFSINAFQELLKFPHLEERIINLAKSYMKDFDLPMGVVWAHFFLSERFEKANELFQVCKIPFEKIDSIILKHVQQTENFEIGKKYAEFISEQDCKDRSKERAYGAVLDLLVLKNMNDEAVNLFMDAKSKNVHLEKYYQSTLTTLKSSLERENKHVPFSMGEN